MIHNEYISSLLTEIKQQRIWNVTGVNPDKVDLNLVKPNDLIKINIHYNVISTYKVLKVDNNTIYCIMIDKNPKNSYQGEAWEIGSKALFSPLYNDFFTQSNPNTLRLEEHQQYVISTLTEIKQLSPVFQECIQLHSNLVKELELRLEQLSEAKTLYSEKTLENVKILNKYSSRYINLHDLIASIQMHLVHENEYLLNTNEFKQKLFNSSWVQNQQEFEQYFKHIKQRAQKYLSKDPLNEIKQVRKIPAYIDKGLKNHPFIGIYINGKAVVGDIDYKKNRAEFSAWDSTQSKEYEKFFNSFGVKVYRPVPYSTYMAVDLSNFDIIDDLDKFNSLKEIKQNPLPFVIDDLTFDDIEWVEEPVIDGQEGESIRYYIIKGHPVMFGVGNTEVVIFPLSWMGNYTKIKNKIGDRTLHSVKYTLKHALKTNSIKYVK
jgi:hypothetical protein